MFYHKTNFNEADIDQVLEESKNLIEQDLEGTHEMKPLIRVNLKGSLKKGLSPGDPAARA